MRGVRLGFSWLIVMASGAAGGAHAEVPSVPPTTDSRPVILVEHEIHDASPFSTDGTAAREAPAHSGAVTRLPPVSSPNSPASLAATPQSSPTDSQSVVRWQPESRLEPAIRARHVAAPRSDAAGEGWKSVTAMGIDRSSPAGSDATMVVSLAESAPAYAMPNAARPIASSGYRTTTVPVMAIPTSGPWPPQALPSHPYAISGVNPQVPPPRSESSYLSRNVWGETKEYFAGQPVRNAWRYLVP